MNRVIAIFLDGYEPSLQHRMAEAGELPALAALSVRSARFRLDHGPAQFTGLAGEHVASGLSPEAAGRQAAVHFDPATYRVGQVGAMVAPFAARLDCRTVAFDMPYFDLAAAPQVTGVGNWGAHDPGVPPAFQPAGLRAGFAQAIGAYPAAEWIYGYVWPSPERTRTMGADLTLAVDRRTEAVRWLLAQRPDWELALVGVSEPHSAIEALWHGIDPGHPLHGLPSAAPAGEGVRAVYRAVDRLVGRLAADWPDASIVLFSMHGMGGNHSDTASMLLLPELLHRHAFGAPLFRPEAVGRMREGIVWPVVPQSWEASMQRGLPWWRPSQWRGALAQRGPAPLARVLAWHTARRMGAIDGAMRSGIEWMPAAAYQPYWRRMAAFSLPSFYDGRLRINLAGRERDGVVPPERYREVRESYATLLHECVDAHSGEPLVQAVAFDDRADPGALGPTDADLMITWRRSTQALRHPRLGTIGPIPLRRPGGHTGPAGMAWVTAAGVEPGDRGTRSAFDVVPTLLALLGRTVTPPPSGRPLLAPEFETA